jgi:hypothetical protein
MSDTAWLKLVEVGGLVAALAAFVWWQWRDLAVAKRESAARKEREARAVTAPATGEREPP